MYIFMETVNNIQGHIVSMSLSIFKFVSQYHFHIILKYTGDVSLLLKQ